MELSENNDVSALVPAYSSERKYISASHKSAKKYTRIPEARANVFY